MPRTDLERSQETVPRSIVEVAADLGLTQSDIELYGLHKAKIAISAVNKLLEKESGGKLILVTAITPTRAGEGKTTVCVGLAQALSRTGAKAICAIREPSMGPVFGIKGGATGGGRAQVVPSMDINLHFTGDLHAVTAADNLLAALIDNHIFHGNTLEIDSRSIAFRRAIDMNDRSLRTIVTGLGGKENGYPTEGGFNITAASEVMAILCLSETVSELKERLRRIVVAQNRSGRPVTAGDLQAQGAMALLLKDAVKPNLVQTLEGTPAFVHGGPFANIAHGCSSVLASHLALQLSDYVVTEAGFGSDLGMEKFCHLVAANNPKLRPAAVVMVATARALKLHGGVASDDLDLENVEAVSTGICNLARHMNIAARFGVPTVIAVNRFQHDTENEIAAIMQLCQKHGWNTHVCDVFTEGGSGGLELAQAVRDACDSPSIFQPMYAPDDPVIDKLRALATRVYGARSLDLSDGARKQLQWLEQNGFGHLAVCAAKTQYSLSDDSSRIGAPSDFSVLVRGFQLFAGAGFVVALMGNILTMPGLPKHPSAVDMDVDDDGNLIHP